MGGIFMAMIDTYRRNVVKKREDIAKLASDKAKEKEKTAVQGLRERTMAEMLWSFFVR